MSDMTAQSVMRHFIKPVAVSAQLWWKPGRKFSFASQCRAVTMIRAEVDWLKAAPVHITWEQHSWQTH
jgi:hypothetical protein